MTTISYFIIRAAPQSERRASAKLIELGYHSFLPVEKKHLRKRGEGKRHHPRVREYPMFLGYAFIGCANIREAWCRLRLDDHVYPSLVRGVGPLGMLSASGELLPYALPASEVAYLLSLQGKSIPYRASVDLHRAHLIVKEGGKARAVDGPFAGREGPVRRIVAGKAHMDVEFLGSMREVPIALEDLVAVA